MTLVTGIDDVKNTFLGNWKQYVPAILCFAEQSGKKHLLGVMERLDVFSKYKRCFLSYIFLFFYS